MVTVITISKGYWASLLLVRWNSIAMPIHEIQVKEYECAWCGYKWINRANGKDGDIPNKCAKCKRSAWINGEAEEAAKPKKSYEQILEEAKRALTA
jgi:phage FluMu protein Com